MSLRKWTVVGAQESWYTTNDEIPMRKVAGHKVLFLNTPRTSTTHRGKGTYLIVDEEWCTAIHEHVIFEPGYTHGIAISTSNNIDWLIVNIYLPGKPPLNLSETEHVVEFIQPIQRWIESHVHSRARVAIMGDFNRTPASPFDRSNGAVKPKDEILANTVAATHWLDTFRLVNPMAREYSRKLGGHKTESRIDLFFSLDHDWKTAAIEDTPDYSSAHRRVIVSTSGYSLPSKTTIPPPLRRWYTGDEAALITFGKLTEKILPNCSTEQLLKEIQTAANSSLHILRKRKPVSDICDNTKTRALREEITTLMALPLVGSEANPDVAFTIKRKRTELERERNALLTEFFREKTVDAVEEPTMHLLFRLCNWKPPLTYLYNLAPVVENNPPSSGSFLEFVRDEFATYFAERLIPHKNITFPTPNKEQMSNDPMLGPITSKIVELILKNAKETAPGKDFITYEMWRMASANVTEAITATVNKTLVEKIWDPSLKTVHILPLPKITTPLTVKHRRPIGLLPTLLKITTSAIDRQLRAYNKKYSIISPEQQAYQAGCSTVNHGRVTRNLIEDAKRNRKVLWILSIDKENAYGTMNHPRSIQVLTEMGLPKDFVDTVESLYDNFEGRVITGRGLSPPFTIKAGVIQGDPLSCLLYVVAASEPVICRLKKLSIGYKSSTLPSSPLISITSYCDDDDVYATSFEDLVILAENYVDTIDWLQCAINAGKTKITLVCPPHLRKKLEKKVLTIHGAQITILSPKEDTRALGFPITSSNKPKIFLDQMNKAT